MKNFIIAIILIYSILLTGCPKADKSLREAREASAKIQVQAIGIIKANTAAFKAGEIDLETFSALTHATGKLVDGIKFYRARLAEAEAVYKATKEMPPKSTLDALAIVFDQRVAGVVLDLVAMLKIVSGPRMEEVRVIVAAIQLVIASIRQLFAVMERYEQELQRQEDYFTWATQS